MGGNLGAMVKWGFGRQYRCHGEGGPTGESMGAILKWGYGWEYRCHGAVRVWVGVRIP